MYSLDLSSSSTMGDGGVIGGQNNRLGVLHVISWYTIGLVGIGLKISGMV